LFDGKAFKFIEPLIIYLQTCQGKSSTAVLKIRANGSLPLKSNIFQAKQLLSKSTTLI